MRATWTPDTTAADSLASLTEQADAIREREQRLAASIADLRGRDVPWRAIGAAIGVSAQAAQQRYGR